MDEAPTRQAAVGGRTRGTVELKSSASKERGSRSPKLSITVAAVITGSDSGGGGGSGCGGGGWDRRCFGVYGSVVEFPGQKDIGNCESISPLY